MAGMAPGLHYTVSMEVVLSDIFPSSWNGTGRLKVGLAKNRVQYKIETNADLRCTEDYVTYEDGLFQDIRIIGSFDLNMTAYPPAEGWKRISASFRAWDNIDAYDWFFIDVEIPGYNPPSIPSNNCFGDFVYVDDVSLKRAEFCTSPCSPDLGPITHSTLPDAMVANGYNPQLGIGPFNMLIENAMGIDFRVFADWQFNAPIWQQYAFDPNGLKDAGWPDYQLYWIGEDANGNVFPQSGSYWYYLKMWNCLPANMIVYQQQSLTYLVGSGNFEQPPDIVNYELDDCCDDHAYFQNTTFTGYFRKDVHDHITAGENVTAGTQGPVVVSSNANVLFHAGNAINLEPGFSVSPGGIFNAVISDCIYGDVKNMGPSRRVHLEKDLGRHDGVAEGITAWPNPSVDGRVHVMVRSQDAPDKSVPIKLIAISMNGRVVTEVAARQGQVEDLVFPESGVYMVRAMDATQHTLGVVKVVVL